MASGNKRFNGKVVMITGSSTGLGAEFARSFAAEGASVFLTGRNVEGLEAVAAECRKLGGKALYVAGDITSDVLLKELVQTTLSEFGKIDILINNAGMSLARSTILDPNFEAFDIIHNVNLRSVYHLCGMAAPHIVKTKGNIVNISSIAAMRTPQSTSAYGIAKAGLDMLTRCLAAELAPHGVRVNGVNPGAFRTDFMRFRTTYKDEQAKMYDNMSSTYPLGRVGEPAELANFVLFLASDAASFMTGINAPVDGGALVK